MPGHLIYHSSLFAFRIELAMRGAGVVMTLNRSIGADPKF